MESPTRKVREQLGLSLTEMAMGSGVLPGQISLCEKGATPIPARLYAFLEEMPGVNIADLTRDHLQFRLGAAEAIRARASGRGGEIPAAAVKVATAGVCK